MKEFVKKVRTYLTCSVKVNPGFWLQEYCPALQALIALIRSPVVVRVSGYIFANKLLMFRSELFKTHNPLQCNCITVDILMQ
jgi:hypothetical protein